MTKEEGLHFFYSVMVAYGFDVEVGRCGFCKGCDSLWVFSCLRFWFGKSKIYFILELKKKKKKRKHFNWLFMKLAFCFYLCVLELIICRFLCRFFIAILFGMSHSHKNKNQWWFQVFSVFLRVRKPNFFFFFLINGCVFSQFLFV